jgi:hypothetical protein
MDELRTLTQDQLDRVTQRLLSPIPGGKVEAAMRFGIDVSLLLEQLRLSPAERVRRMQQIAETAEGLRGAARRPRK